jgi:hypothetical protein
LDTGEIARGQAVADAEQKRATRAAAGNTEGRIVRRVVSRLHWAGATLTRAASGRAKGATFQVAPLGPV